MIDTSTTVNQTPTKNAQSLTRKRVRHSKRIQKFKRAAQGIRYIGNWDIMISVLRPGHIVLLGDGVPVVYFKAQRGLFWYKITETKVPFSHLLKEGQTVSLPDITKVFNYVERY